VAPGPDDVIAHYQAISVTSKLAQQWSVAGQGAFDSTPSVVQGVLYAGDESGNLYAVTETTGQPVFTDALGAPVDTTPAVDGGSVLVATTDGVLHQVDAATGAAGWTRTVGGQPTSPTVSGGTIYVGSSNGTLTAVAEGTGTVEWTRSIGGAVTAAPAVSTSPSAVVVTDQDGTVEALSTAGKVQWTASPGGALTGALVDGKAVVVASSTGAVTDLTLAKGTVVWRASTGSAVTAPPVESYGNLVTVGNAAGVVTYYSAAKGSVVNTQAFFGHPITGITSTQGIILLTSTWGLGMIEGAQYVRMTWLFPRAAGYATAGVFLNGDLFVAGGDGLIRGFTVPGRAMA
jgi:outer membrane protein assembly factor BamB